MVFASGNPHSAQAWRVLVAEVDQIAVRDALAPIWQEKADTARKAANRLNIVLKHAVALGLTVDL